MEVPERSITDDHGDKAKWNLAYFEAAANEGRDCLTPVQYAHAVSLMEQLAFEDDPTHPGHAFDVRPIEGVHELREKGSVFGRINLRIYFWACKETQTLFTLCVDKKEA